MIKFVLHKLLEIPIIFQIQQKVCNNYDAVLEEFSDYLKSSKKSIIEIGCSTANCATEIIDMKNNYYVGVDLDQNYIERAKKMHLMEIFFPWMLESFHSRVKNLILQYLME